MFLERLEPVKSFADWRRYRAEYPKLADANYIEELVEDVRRNGLIDPLLGHMPPEKIVIDSPNYRESLTAGRMNCRRRAIGWLIAQRLQQTGAATKIYVPEGRTDFALILSRISNCQGSVYRPTLLTRLRYPWLRVENVTQLRFRDGSFDLYVSCDILEHVPDIPRTLHEARRVLRPGGEFLATFPFLRDRETSHCKAELRDGRIVYHDEPEYHGHHLVYTNPGWDILDACRSANFKSAEMVAVSSRTHGVVSRNLAVIFVLRAVV